MIPAADVVLLDSRDFFVQQSGLTGRAMLSKKVYLKKATGQEIWTVFFGSESQLSWGPTSSLVEQQPWCLVVGGWNHDKNDWTNHQYLWWTNLFWTRNEHHRFVDPMVAGTHRLLYQWFDRWGLAGSRGLCLQCRGGLDSEMLPISQLAWPRFRIMAKRKVVIKSSTIQDLGAIVILCTDNWNLDPRWCTRIPPRHSWGLGFVCPSSGLSRILTSNRPQKT